MRFFLSAVFLTVSIVGCTDQQPSGASAGSSDASAAANVINDHCPVMGGDVTPDGGTYEWNGKTIGFCCAECVEKFARMSDEEKAAALAKAESGSGDHHDHDHGDHEGHDDHDHGAHDEGSHSS